MQLFSLLNNIVHGKQNAGFFLSIWYIYKYQPEILVKKLHFFFFRLL